MDSQFTHFIFKLLVRTANVPERALESGEATRNSEVLRECLLELGIGHNRKSLFGILKFANDQIADLLDDILV